MKIVISKSKKLKGKILSIGITNQRETTILWDKKTGKHVYNAIVWQDRRTEEYCKKIKKKENLIRKKTGLFIDPYFSATKIEWILENVPKAKNLLKKKQLLFGTIDSFLIWKLTNGKVHATDATNASRTMLFNINKNNWDNEILKIFKINKNKLPIVKNSADDFGYTSKKVIGEKIPISGADVLILGFSFKENCNDFRNTKVIDIVENLKSYGINPTIVDPIIDKDEAFNEYKLDIQDKIPSKKIFKAIIIAVAHDQFKLLKKSDWERIKSSNSVLIDIKNILPNDIEAIRL